MASSRLEPVSKPFLTLASPRTGSTFTQGVVGHYLNVTRGTENIGEIFNYSLQSFWEEGGSLRSFKHPWRMGRQKPAHGELVRPIREFRFSLLLKYSESVFPKVMSTHLPFEKYEALAERFEWIWVERRNLFEQYLSYLVSRASGRWYEPDGLRIEEHSLTAKQEYVGWFESHFIAYNKLKKRFGAKRVIVYEDHVEASDPQRILDALGFTEKVSFEGADLVCRQNKGSKLRLFNNPEMIIDAYRTSWMGQVRPLGASDLEQEL